MTDTSNSPLSSNSTTVSDQVNVTTPTIAPPAPNTPTNTTPATTASVPSNAITTLNVEMPPVIATSASKPSDSQIKTGTPVAVIYPTPLSEQHPDLKPGVLNQDTGDGQIYDPVDTSAYPDCEPVVKEEVIIEEVVIEK